MTDPDNDLESGTSGADIVAESLNRICLWEIYGDKGCDGGLGETWWQYVETFDERCTAEVAGQDPRFADVRCAWEV